jgi:hypothetical protein
MGEIIHHLAFFVSRLWQIHAFGEGNTRTTAVFFIKYLKTLGFDTTNDIFAENAWFFRNALHNRSMHISGRFEKEVDIECAKVDIEDAKVDIRNKILSTSNTISEKTINHAMEIFTKCGRDDCFGRTMVEDITGLKSSGASKLIKLLRDSDVIVSVSGHGKGKYRFR